MDEAGGKRPINENAQPDIELAMMKRLFESLPDDWKIMLDSPSKILLFDAELTGQGFIDLTTGQVVTLQG